VGPLGRIPFAIRALLWALAVLALGLAFGFSAPVWIGAAVGLWIAAAQWRRERLSARRTAQAR
jgi:hypothetical protein